MRKWLRVLICLLLVCCILVNLSPLRAEAVSATAIACSVAIPVAVAIGLQAVGVRQGSDSSAFNNVVSSAVDALSPEWAVNGLTTMLALTTDGITKTYVSKNFLQSLLDFLHSNDVISDSFAPHSAGSTISVTDYFGTHNYSSSVPFLVGYVYLYYQYGSALNQPYIIYVAYDYGYIKRYGSDGSLTSQLEMTANSFGSRVRTTHCGNVNPEEAGWTLPYLGTFYSEAELYQAFVSPGSISTSEDLTLESVGHDIDTDYETYVETGIVGIDFGVQFEDDPNTNRNEEDDGKGKWVPVAIPSIYTNPYTDQTQAEAQTGNTLQDVLDSLLQNSGSGDGTGDSTGEGSGTNTGTWKPPSDHNKFALADLSKFFPFCIPFDLYDFFTLLNADPVAPVLSWEIKDLAGQTYSLDVDLSQWDSVALLFRRLQLFLFITGLAAASRKFIKW